MNWDIIFTLWDKQVQENKNVMLEKSRQDGILIQAIVKKKASYQSQQPKPASLSWGGGYAKLVAFLPSYNLSPSFKN